MTKCDSCTGATHPCFKGDTTALGCVAKPSTCGSCRGTGTVTATASGFTTIEC